MADEEFNPTAWGAKPVEQAPENPLDWGAKPAAPPDRGVLERAGSAMGETFQSGLEAGKKLFTSRTKEEAEEGYGVTGALKGLKETAQGVLSPVTMAIGAPMAGVESLITSGMGALARGTGRGIAAGLRPFSPGAAEKIETQIPTSEEAYKALSPQVGTAMLALGARPGFSALTTAETIPNRLSKALIKDNDTPAAINQRLAVARQTKPEATLADVGGKNVRDIVENVAQTPGGARADIVPFLEQRQKQQLTRLSDDLTAQTGTRQTAFRAIEDTMEQRKIAADPLYRQAYADGDFAVWSPELERLSGAPFVQSAMRRAVSTWKNNAIADGYGAMNPSNVDRGGILTFGKSVPVFPNLQFWDYTKHQLDGMASAALRAGQNGKARTLTRLTQQLRTQLDAQVPSYAGARDAWSGSSRYIDAIEDGRSIFNRNITAEEFAHNFNALSEAEKEGQRIGIVGTILQKMKSNPAKLPDLTRELRSQDMREKMAAIMPTPQAAEKFNQALDYEVRSSELVHQSLANSATYRRLMQKVDAENIFGEAALHILAPHHSLRGMFINLFKTFSKPVRDALRSRMDQRLAEMLTETGPSAGIPLTGKIPMRRSLVYGPLAGTSTVESPKGFKHGGRVTKSFRFKQ